MCRGTYTVTAADVTAGQVTNTATASGLPPGGRTGHLSAIHRDRAARVRLALTKDGPDPTAVRRRPAGQYGYTVTNTGGSTLTNVAVTDNRIPSARLVCQANVLARGQHDVHRHLHRQRHPRQPAGRIVNTARATGSTPIGQTVESPEVQAAIAVNTDIAVTKVVDN